MNHLFEKLSEMKVSDFVFLCYIIFIVIVFGTYVIIYLKGM